jgi:erythromycin esterase-like protein
VKNRERDLYPLPEQFRDAKCVLLREISRSTSEFYAWWAEITKCLVTEKRFSFVAVEGDWPVGLRLEYRVGQGFNKVPVLKFDSDQLRLTLLQKLSQRRMRFVLRRRV